MQVSARAQCTGCRGRDGETRGQNTLNLGRVPFPRRLDQRLFILHEQLLALLCIPGLVGRLGLRDAGFGESSEHLRQDIRWRVNARAPCIKGS